MFKIQEIREMIKLVDNSTIEVLEIEEGNSKIMLCRSVGANSVVSQEIPPARKQSNHVIAEISKAQVQVAATTDTLEKVHSSEKKEDNKKVSKIVSPMVGTFYIAPGEDAPPFVKVGEKVEKSTVVCILEAMKLFNEIEAEMDGEIVEVLVENGQLVEYGQPLFLVKRTS
ncbi:acetyl-CoA carboxylase biotin carboxyl carrier protein [Neobacillus bataviensis]|uniref:acetyl-CoA carboxylase biotin carboxyl carrier protein n=1 Tax=Neobacillus bataviensis TaxID=220685 RepID=UPI001CC1285F|nr:acetyl-CoA carboxylase biotin carboxyl carrier protein [Neobacillus bataviensis]